MKWLIVASRAAQALVVVLALFGVRPAAETVTALVAPPAVAAPALVDVVRLFASSSNSPAPATRR